MFNLVLKAPPRLRKGGRGAVVPSLPLLSCGAGSLFRRGWKLLAGPSASGAAPLFLGRAEQGL